MIDGSHALDRRRADCCSGDGCSGDREAGSNRGWPEIDASRLRTPDHPETPATGSAFEATPVRAVQVAAWETLTRA